MKKRLLKIATIALAAIIGLAMPAIAQESATVKLPRHLKLTSSSWYSDQVLEGNLTYDNLGRVTAFEATMGGYDYTYQTAFTWNDKNQMLTEDNATRGEKIVNIYDENHPDFWIGSEEYYDGSLSSTAKIEHKFDSDGKWIGLGWRYWYKGWWSSGSSVSEYDITVDKFDDKDNISELTLTIKEYEETTPEEADIYTYKFENIKWVKDVDYDEIANVDYRHFSGRKISSGDFPQQIAFNFLLSDKNQVESLSYSTEYSISTYNTVVEGNMKAIICETTYPDYPEETSIDVTFRKYNSETGGMECGTEWPETRNDITYTDEYSELYVPIKPELSFLKLYEELFEYASPYYDIASYMVVENGITYVDTRNGELTYTYDEEGNITMMKFGSFTLEFSDFGEYNHVNSIAQDIQWSARGAKGAIELSASEAQPASIYNLAGKVVYDNAGLVSATVPMAPGMYVVKIGGNVRKVIVR